MDWQEREMLHWVVCCFINFNPRFKFSSRMGLLYLWAGGNFFSLPWKHGDGRSVVHWQVGEDERKADDREARGNKRVQVVPWGALQQVREVLLCSALGRPSWSTAPSAGPFDSMILYESVKVVPDSFLRHSLTNPVCA